MHTYNLWLYKKPCKVVRYYSRGRECLARNTHLKQIERAFMHKGTGRPTGKVKVCYGVDIKYERGSTMSCRDRDFEDHAKGRNLNLDVIYFHNGTKFAYYSAITHEAWQAWEASKNLMKNKAELEKATAEAVV